MRCEDCSGDAKLLNEKVKNFLCLSDCIGLLNCVDYTNYGESCGHMCSITYPNHNVGKEPPVAEFENSASSNAKTSSRVRLVPTFICHTVGSSANQAPTSSCYPPCNG